jgi:hypothetical protein
MRTGLALAESRWRLNSRSAEHLPAEFPTTTTKDINMLRQIHHMEEQVEPEHSAIRTVARYLHQLRSITIIRLLVRLFIASQQHRGATLALFEGNEQFRTRVATLQNEINNRLLTLEMINSEFAETLSGTELMQLKWEWDTVREWEGGTALENFNLQSHFIEQQMKLIWSIAQTANCFAPTMPAAAASDGSHQPLAEEALSGDALLIKFVLSDMPELIELIAKIRGLATHVTVLAFCDDVHHSLLEYLLKTLNQQKEKFREFSRRLESYVFGDIPAIIDLQILDTRIVNFIQVVEKKILSRKKITINSQEIFDMATDIIEAHSVVITQGLEFIRTKIHKQLDEWHVNHKPG